MPERPKAREPPEPKKTPHHEHDIVKERKHERHDKAIPGSEDLHSPEGDPKE